VPRKARRIDIVLLVRDVIVIVEAKTNDLSSAARQQVETYALLLHYFHKASANRRIVPVLVSKAGSAPDLVALNQREFYPQMPSYWIAPVLSSRTYTDQDKGAPSNHAIIFDEAPRAWIPNGLWRASARRSRNGGQSQFRRGHVSLCLNGFFAAI